METVSQMEPEPETDSNVLKEGNMLELIEYARYNLLDINKEICGFIEKSGSKLKLVKNSEGPEIDDDGNGSCIHSRNERIMWHTHPNNVKRFYPSVEDVVKILKHSSIYESFIFCKYGVWKMVFLYKYNMTEIGDITSIKLSQASAEPYKTTIGYLINSLNKKLDAATDGNYDRSAITDYCNSLNSKIRKFKITFTTYDGEKLGSKKRKKSEKRKSKGKTRKKSKRNNSKRKKSKRNNSKKKRKTIKGGTLITQLPKVVRNPIKKLSKLDIKMIKDKTDEQKKEEEQEKENKLDALDVVLQKYFLDLEQTPTDETLKIIKQISKVHPSLGKRLQDLFLKEYSYDSFAPSTLEVFKIKYPHNDNEKIIKLLEKEYESYKDFREKEH